VSVKEFIPSQHFGRRNVGRYRPFSVIQARLLSGKGWPKPVWKLSGRLRVKRTYVVCIELSLSVTSTLRCHQFTPHEGNRICRSCANSSDQGVVAVRAKPLSFRHSCQPICLGQAGQILGTERSAPVRHFGNPRVWCHSHQLIKRLPCLAETASKRIRLD
jgi:hypothetical protein